MTLAATQTLSPAEIVLAYHARTRHTPERYAAGPETLDWDAQPNPFREFDGSPRTLLPLTTDRLATRFARLHTSEGVAPAPATLASVAALMELAMGLSAWKEHGPDRWALRCNPSSGNLHPTEAYVLSSNVAGLASGLHHYVSRDHALELRCRNTDDPDAPVGLWIGLSSVHWREAWKYGERAFRYCQLDIGHAIGALSYAAAALGWRARLVEGLAGHQLAALLGLDRAADFAGAEPEDADLLVAIDCAPSPNPAQPGAAPAWQSGRAQWTGHANLLDPHPMYRWPVIGQVSVATQGHATELAHHFPDLPPRRHASDARAADILLGRRSAQRFDGKSVMASDVFYRLVDSVMVRPAPPWDVWNFAPRLHPVFFIHRVEGLAPGLYALPRRVEATAILRDAMRPDFEWQTPNDVPAHLPLVRLMSGDFRSIARNISCHQAIAGDGCFSLSMIGEFEPVVRSNAWRYRQLHWEAGLLGHALYLEAEAAGLRGTGIGCYFDDALHSLLGIETAQLKALYHFTVGRPIIDDRISTLPPYPGRSRNEDMVP
ncbi:MAG TPA: nitroreductase family protein [Tardiphaga sp.]